MDRSNQYVRAIVWGIPAVITIILVVTIATLYVTSKDIPESLTQLVGMLIPYWLGLIAPSPFSDRKYTGD